MNPPRCAAVVESSVRGPVGQQCDYPGVGVGVVSFPGQPSTDVVADCKNGRYYEISIEEYVGGYDHMDTDNTGDSDSRPRSMSF